MAKKTDLKFTDKEAFMKAHPHFVIEKHIPAHTQREPNYGAIRAVLRAGQKIDGVELAEVATSDAKSTESNAQDTQAPGTQTDASTVESDLTASHGGRTLGKKLSGKK